MINELCPTCGRRWRVPVNFLNYACCAAVRDAALAGERTKRPVEEQVETSMLESTQEVYRRAQHYLTARIAEIEGHEVTPEELAEHGEREAWEGDETCATVEIYKWRGVEVLRVRFFVRQGDQVVHKLEPIQQ